MKDYKLSELKEICSKYIVRGRYGCDAETECPIKDDCENLCMVLFTDLQIDVEDNDNA